jgi:peptidase E
MASTFSKSACIAMVATKNLSHAGAQTGTSNTIFLSRFSGINAQLQFQDFIRKEFDTKQLLYIPTAAFCLDKRSSRPIGEQRRRARYDAKQKAQLLAQAFNSEAFSLLELDAAQLKEDDIKKKIESASIVYVDGGNTFYLQRHALTSGFWDHMAPFFHRGGLYIGASAGAIVAGKSIRTAYWKGWDDPLVAGEDFEWNDGTLSGAALRHYSVFPHYCTDQHADLVAQKRGELYHDTQVIPDDVALVHHRGESFVFYSDGRRELL